MSQESSYNPSALIDYVIDKLGAKNDAELSRMLETNPPQISKVRRGHLPVGDSLLVRIHEATNTGTKELKRIAGMA